MCSKEQHILDPPKAEGIEAFPAIEMDFYSTLRYVFTLFMALILLLTRSERFDFCHFHT